MKKGYWNDSEVVDLFNLVENIKEHNKPLKDAFIAHAEKYSRKPNSVRNYYYYQLEELKNNTTKTNRLGIDLSLHEKTEFDYFSRDEEKKLIDSITSLINSGLSLRKACLQLSDGDITKMLRYQNKYRAYQAKINTTKELPNNIITFTQKKKDFLSDSDINSLFLGLVRLVKRNASQELNSRYQEEKDMANNALRKAMLDLSKKDRELDKLKEDFIKLKLENSRLVQNLMKLKCEKAEKLNKLSKNSRDLARV